MSVKLGGNKLFVTTFVYTYAKIGPGKKKIATLYDFFGEKRR
mgnify:CR=1 FL=1